MSTFLLLYWYITLTITLSAIHYRTLFQNLPTYNKAFFPLYFNKFKHNMYLNYMIKSRIVRSESCFISYNIPHSSENTFKRSLSIEVYNF